MEAQITGRADGALLIIRYANLKNFVKRAARSGDRLVRYARVSGRVTAALPHIADLEKAVTAYRARKKRVAEP